MHRVQSVIAAFIHAHSTELAKVDFVVGISRGGLVPSALIATKLDKPLVAAYIDRQDRVYLDRGAWLKGKHILIVDDIVRTGKTFKKIEALVARHNPSSIQSFTLFCMVSSIVRPTWTTLTKTDRSFPWD